MHPTMARRTPKPAERSRTIACKAAADRPRRSHLVDDQHIAPRHSAQELGLSVRHQVVRPHETHVNPGRHTGGVVVEVHAWG